MTFAALVENHDDHDNVLLADVNDYHAREERLERLSFGDRCRVGIHICCICCECNVEYPYDDDDDTKRVQYDGNMNRKHWDE